MQVDKIKNMKFEELREELARCDDPVKANIIRKIMKKRYVYHQQRKARISQEKVDLEKKRRSRLKDKIKKELQKELHVDKEEPEDTLDGLFEPQGFDPQGIGAQQGFDPQGIDQGFDPQQGDIGNDRLMSRLHNDINIRELRVKPNDVFVPPFANDPGDTFAKYHK